ncbi:MAG: ABC transporter permease [Myxococcota bacterium]|nr:ABC transporter permease [Myxococcota bacterium]
MNGQVNSTRDLKERVIRRFSKSPIAMISISVIGIYAFAALLVTAGLIATDVDTRVGEKFMSPNFSAWLGTDRLGRDILSRVIYANKIAFIVGLVTATLSVLLGTILGAISGFFGGWIDALVVWLYSTVESIPYLLLLIAISYITGTGLSGVYLAFVLTFWVAPCRVIRGEVIKLKEAEYVIAAQAMGYGPLRILFRHIVPNTVHLSLINFTLIFVAAIKSEVILSYLGLGVQGEPSWGTMIDQARAELVNGFFWQIGGATIAMFILVLAFNVAADTLQRALDPRDVQ